MDPPMLRLEKKERRNYEMKTTVRYVYLSTLSLYRISRIMSSILLDFFRQKCYNFILFMRTISGCRRVTL